MEKETIDNWSLLLTEYPFVKEGMFAEDYWEERLYWGMHLAEVREETYKPIWKQRMGEIGDECVTDEFFNIEYSILSELKDALGKQEVDISRFDAKSLKMEEKLWECYIDMLGDAGYITGVINKLNAQEQIIMDCSNIKITERGLEHLQKDPIMQKLHVSKKSYRMDRKVHNMTEQEREEGLKERERIMAEEKLKAFPLTEKEIEELKKQGRL